MNFETYQTEARTTARPSHGDDRLALCISTLGLVGEAGEVSEIIKKLIGHGHELDRDAVTKELGDVLWYVSDIASQLDIALDDIAYKNISKLKNRYPQGFSSDKSINRED